MRQWHRPDQTWEAESTRCWVHYTSRSPRLRLSILGTSCYARLLLAASICWVPVSDDNRTFDRSVAPLPPLETRPFCRFVTTQYGAEGPLHGQFSTSIDATDDPTRPRAIDLRCWIRAREFRVPCVCWIGSYFEAATLLSSLRCRWYLPHVPRGALNS